MDFLFKSSLSKEDISKIDELEAAEKYSIFHDGNDFGFPAYFFAYDKQALVGYLSLTPSGSPSAFGGNMFLSVDALVATPYRRNGIFKLLLKSAHEKAPNLNFLASVSVNTHFDIKGTSLGNDLIYSDIFLILDNDDYIECNITCHDNLKITHTKNCYQLTILSAKGRSSIGTVKLCPASDFTNIWGVEIKKPYRRKGYGFALLSYVINDYFKSSRKPLLLHVESTNHAALGLYHKLGFTTHVQIDNYRI